MTKLLKIATTILATFALVACGESEGGSGKDSLPISREQSEQKMEQLAETDGYYVKFKYSSSSNGEQEDYQHLYFGYKGGVVWAGDDEGGMALKEDEANVHYYSYSEGAYEYVASISKSEMEGYEASYKLVYSTWLYWGNTYDGQLKKGKDDTVAGRSCYTYTFNYSAVSELGAYAALLGNASDAKVTYKIWVEKEYGVTMKIHLEGESDGESGTFDFEVTEFKTGSQVTVPTLPPAVPQED